MKEYIKVDNFVVKLRAYPNKEQREKIDRILQGIKIAYNVTAYEITKGNEAVTKVRKEDGSRWPDFKGCKNKKWLNYLRANYPIVNAIPSTSLSTNYGIFVDMEKSWLNFHPIKIPKEQEKTKTGKPKFNKKGEPIWKKTEEPVRLPCDKWKPEYYSNKKPRTSFTVQTKHTGFFFSDESKSVYIRINGVGKVKCRGWRYDLRFGDVPEYTFKEFFANTNKGFGVTVSKDNCGDYWAIVKLQTVWLSDKKSENKKEIGVDVGVKDIAITSDGKKYENKHFARNEKKKKRLLNRKLSRRQGWANIKFREEHKKDKTIKPSKRYEKTKLKLAKLERKIARRRENYNNNVSIDIVRNASFIGIESLKVSGMMQNKKMSYALADAAMYSVLSKIKYKSAWRNIPVKEIGRYDPSSQTCSSCGYINKEVKNLDVREWTCPKCGAHHDRDINAAINIRNFAYKIV